MDSQLRMAIQATRNAGNGWPGLPGTAAPSATNDAETMPNPMADHFTGGHIAASLLADKVSS